TPSARPVASSAFAIYGRSRIDLAPTARSSASSRRCFVSGPTRGPTARRTSAAGRCPAGSATTTPSARTRRSATSRRWPFSGGPGDERAWTQQLAVVLVVQPVAHLVDRVVHCLARLLD